MDTHVDAASIWNSTSCLDEYRVEFVKIVDMIPLDVIATFAKRASIKIQRNPSPTKKHANVSRFNKGWITGYFYYLFY